MTMTTAKTMALMTIAMMMVVAAASPHFTYSGNDSPEHVDDDGDGDNEDDEDDDGDD